MRESEEERKDCLNPPVGSDMPKSESSSPVLLSKVKKALLSLLKAVLTQLPILSINFLLLGSGSMFFSESTATIDKKTINGHHAQATVTGHLSNTTPATGLVEQQYLQLLEDRLQDKEELVESLKLLVESQQKQIALLEEEVGRLREEN